MTFLTKIIIGIVISSLLALWGFHEYNNYKANSLTEKQLELQEKLSVKEAEYEQLTRAEGEQQGGREQVIKEKSIRRQTFEQRTEQTVSEEFKKQAERLKERLK